VREVCRCVRDWVHAWSTARRMRPR
jgi:hypothetical protein